MDTFGSGFTVTVTENDLVQPLASMAVIVYICVAVGVAITEVPVPALRLAAGAQLNVYGGVPPAANAVRVVELPEQIVKLPETEVEIPEGEVIVALSLTEQPTAS